MHNSTKIRHFRNEKLGNRPSELLLRLLGQRKKWQIADLRVPTRPLSSYKNTHFQNEAKYNTFLELSCVNDSYLNENVKYFSY